MTACIESNSWSCTFQLAREKKLHRQGIKYYLLFAVVELLCGADVSGIKSVTRISLGPIMKIRNPPAFGACCKNIV